ncbi:hypothetical protein [Myxococcus sp. RHSTA-1-4]|uniref:tetratricopeptide repeat protein n=1 Tax=Myxococcus sp. RHSTA-1-4 TaxID=2874601 RepID=UPI001CBDD726|nr:hypothetical protein [Myxococcus sp. RHSTA-1-4]MBZ4417555.1 hypothetical protein [Myxococcus sp. RHSTA-1-4]
MGERELMKLRELKEAAHALFVRGRYAQCAETYARILRLAPKDPNVRVRHAECCRRAGDRQSAVASYRAAAALLMEQGCESRARGALRAALELDPKDPMLHSDLAQLGQPKPPSTAMEDERLYSGNTGFFERLDARADRRSPPPPPPAYVLRAAEETRATGPLPAAPSITPLNVEALQRAAGRVAPIPLLPPAAPPGTRRESSSLPIVQGRLITQPPVPSHAPAAGAGARPHGATLAPVPPAMRLAGATLAGVPVTDNAGGPLTMVPVPGHGAGNTRAAPGVGVMPYRPELRRLGPNAVALRVSPQARWVIIRSDSPLEVSRAETLPVAQQPVAGCSPE